MVCKKIELHNFRNIEYADVSFSSGINIVSGENAQGKTNLLEAIGLTSLGRSFRQACDGDMIRFGCECAEIKNTYFDGQRECNIDVKLFDGRRQKKIEKNKVKIAKMSEIVGSFKVVVFFPEHLSIVKDGPAVRRNFLDVALSQIKPLYIKSLQRYNNILKQRNTLIKDAEKNCSVFKNTVDIWSEQLAYEAALITKYRINYLHMAKKYIDTCFCEMTNEMERPELTYISTSGLCEEDCLDENRCREAYLSLYNSHHDREICAGATLWGIHKDDIDMELNGRKARFYCSQGQQRSLALSMKLAEGEIIKDMCGGEYPVFLLDDVFSELDARRREYLISNIVGKQVILTSCEPSIIEGCCNFISVKNGEFK